jgi:hypothetical protein
MRHENGLGRRPSAPTRSYMMRVMRSSVRDEAPRTLSSPAVINKSGSKRL